MISRRGLALLTARRPLFSAASASQCRCPTAVGLTSTLFLRFRNEQTAISRIQVSGRAWESTTTLDPNASPSDKPAATPSPPPEADGDKSGRIAVSTNESILFFDNIFPLKLSNVLNWSWKTDHDVADLIQRFESSSLGIMDPIRLVKTAIPEDLPIKVTEILPRLKDGGAYVKFSHDASIDPAEIEATLIKRLTDHPIKPWFSLWRGVTARLVQGTPWLEDLYRYPTSLLKVEFVPPSSGVTPEELPEESLYTLFRKYGKIADIIPQPNDSKVVPRYAHIGFPLARDSIMARNCMHGFVASEAFGGGLKGTKLRLSYEKRVKAHSIWNWVTNHTRIVLPIIAALLAGLSVIIFDPIREFFIKLHIQHSLNFKDSRIYKWFKKQTGNFSLGNKKEKDDGLSAVWKHRRDVINQVHSWLDETSDTFIVVTGPKGSGKVEMVMNQSLDGRKNVLKIDCRPIVDARGEAGTIKKLAAAVGYRPIFSWANSMSSMVDLAVQSTTGVKVGFTETLESQLTKILQTTTSALMEVAVSGRSKRDSDANLADDAYLEAHPERRPVIVIDNFLHKGEENGIVYEKIAEWSASVVQNNIAHVIFLTTDSAYSKPLTKALPDRLFRTVSLGDLAPTVAKSFVLSRLKDQLADEENKAEKDKTQDLPVRRPDLAQLDQHITTLGGRLTDLESLARRLRTGQTPRDAVNEIVDETATDIVRMFLLGKGTDVDSKKWSSQQAWHLIKLLAETPSLRYNQVLLSGPFAASSSVVDGETALESLVTAELITVRTKQGRPELITPGKPLHQAAFSVLLRDRVLRAKMDLDIITDMSKAETRSIDKYETELALLGSLPRQPRETADRISFLLTKLQVSQVKVAEWDKETVKLKKILNEEY
ncbi:RNA12 protein-domain-containing protein [Dactylonectria estremocensis]|uniref:Mitochondrial escape protein 2 n=1 Tax=Dactylonectria estremocensis TaxID=1079267 RepID=A0A9P9JEL5_9HYPO|nr:RNA12 protein-domain-containing protein [Dactylonectria estremocensis]